MDLEKVNTVDDMAEWIRWSIRTPGTSFDGWILSEEEIHRIAEGIFNLANASYPRD